MDGEYDSLYKTSNPKPKLRKSKQLKKENRAKQTPKWYNDRNSINYLSDDTDYQDNYCYECDYVQLYGDLLQKNECQNIGCRLRNKKIQVWQEDYLKQKQDIFLNIYKGCQTIDDHINDLKKQLEKYANNTIYQQVFSRLIISKKLYLEKLVNMRNSIIFKNVVTEPRRYGYIPKRLRGKRFTSNMKNRYMPIEEQKLNLDCVNYIIRFIY
jgi:hypothetical protein